MAFNIMRTICVAITLPKFMSYKGNFNSFLQLQLLSRSRVNAERAGSNHN